MHVELMKNTLLDVIPDPILSLIAYRPIVFLAVSA
jgi:hypothetical protein